MKPFFSLGLTSPCLEISSGNLKTLHHHPTVAGGVRLHCDQIIIFLQSRMNYMYFHVGYATKNKAVASKKHNFSNCVSPLRAKRIQTKTFEFQNTVF